VEAAQTIERRAEFLIQSNSAHYGPTFSYLQVLLQNDISAFERRVFFGEKTAGHGATISFATFPALSAQYYQNAKIR
jgi:hypothetical protein